MATLVHQCPHCLTEKISFQILANGQTKVGEGPLVRSFVYLQCTHCGMPAAAEVWDGIIGSYLGPDLRAYPQSLAQLGGWEVIEMWPPVPAPRVPAFSPDAVAKAFLAAERNFHQEGMEEASAGSYGRALDIGTKLFAPDLAKKDLYGRIRGLAEDHRITQPLADWAHAIRKIRNGALHDVDEVTRDELVAIRGFTETLLTYLFTLPGMLKARQGETTEKPK